MERFRVISDLHLDINDEYPFKIKKDGIFTVIAGDTSGHQYIISTNSPDGVSVNIVNDRKLIDFLGKNNGNAELTYSGECALWCYKGKPIRIDDSALYMRKSLLYCSIPDGEKVKIRIKSVEKWLKNHISSGVMVAGNHLVYNNHKMTIEALKYELHERFPIDSSISFLDNSVGVMAKEVDGILFVGSSLYTDYEYVGENNSRYGKPDTKDRAIEMNCRLATPKMSGGGLNDFNFGRTSEGTYEKPKDDTNDTFWLTPKNYLLFFHRTMEELTKIVESNKDKPIVVVTHHCPSPKCISPYYQDSEMNASYVSDLEDFIVKHPNIKCWCCGHVHHRDNFKIGGCRVVMNPLGYCRNGQFRVGESKTAWSFNTFVNTKTWEVEVEDFDISKWNSIYDKSVEKMRKWLGTYGNCFI